MREAITNLTKEESARLEQLLAQHTVDARTASKTHRYYRELRRMQLALDQPHLDDLMRAAIVIAEKSQILYSLAGLPIPSLPLALHDMLRNKVSLPKLTAVLAGFVTAGKGEEEVRGEVGRTVEQLRWGMNFSEKFERAMRYFDFQELTDGYLGMFRSFSWLLFLQTHGQLKPQGVCENDYLLICVLYLTVRHGWDHIRPRHALSQTSNSRQLITAILERLFTIFLIDDPQTFKRISNAADAHFEILLTHTLSCPPNSTAFMAPALLPTNYHALQSLYQRNRTPGSLDHRLFLSDPLPTLTAARLAPPHRKTAQPRSFASHRILTFDLQEVSRVSEPPRPVEIKLPANVKVSPSCIRTPLICARPQSPSMQLQQYMRAHCGRGGLQEEEEELQSLVMQVLQGYLPASQRLTQRAQLAHLFARQAAADYRNQGEEDEQGVQGVEEALLVLSMHLVIYSSLHSQQNPTESRVILEYLRKQLPVSALCLSQATTFLQQMPNPPPQMVNLLSAVQTLIVQELLWLQPSLLQALEVVAASRQAESASEVSLLGLLSAAINEAESLTADMLERLNLSPDVGFSVMRLVKYLLGVAPLSIEGLHLHQIVLCSLYLTLRRGNWGIKFNDILNHYQAAVGRSEGKRVISELPGNLSIIEYYNQSFVPFIKHHLQRVEEHPYHLMATPMREQEESNQEEEEQEEEAPIVVVHEQKEQKRRGKGEMRYYRHTEEAEVVQREEPIKTKLVEQRAHSGERHSTRMRTRPMGNLLNMLLTEKIKSPRP